MNLWDRGGIQNDWIVSENWVLLIFFKISDIKHIFILEQGILEIGFSNLPSDKSK